jgi:cytochrome oxidase assembly protein ShyY1
VILLRPRWVAGHLLVLVLSATFLGLGFWQLARNGNKHRLVREARAAYAAPAPTVTSASPAGTRAEATGRYDTAHEVLLRNQVHGDKGGSDVLTPLLLSDGRAVLVDRGWLEGTDPTSTGPVPSGTVVVRGVVHTSSTLSAQDSVERSGALLSLPRVDVTRIDADVPSALLPVWIEAQSQTPAPEPGAPALPEPPPPDQVNHMQYAIQWFCFAGIGIIGWPIALYSISRRRGGFSTPTD